MRTTDLFKNNRSAKKINESLEKTFGKKLNLETFDLHQLQDARNKLRTQVSQVRGESGFNENLDNDALTQAQWMLDAINAEIGHREEFTIEAVEEESNAYGYEIGQTVELDGGQQGEVIDIFDDSIEVLLTTGETATVDFRDAAVLDEDVASATALALRYYDSVYVEDTPEGVMVYGEDIPGGFADRDGGDVNGTFEFTANLTTGEIAITDHSEEGENDRWADTDEMQKIAADVLEDVKKEYGETWEEISNELEGGMSVDDEGGDTDDSYAMASAGHGSDEDYGDMPEGYDMDQVRKDAEERLKAQIDKQSDDRISKLRHGDKKEPFMAQVGRKIIGGVKGAARGAARGFSGKEGTEVSEKAPPGAKAERMVKHIKKGYADDGKLTDKEKSIAYATAWKQHNKQNESEEQVDELKRSTVKSYAEKKKEAIKQTPPQSKQEVGKDLKGVKGALDRLKGAKPTSESVNTGDNMTNRLHEGEIQQAQSIVTAKTMVDRVGRWIEELSGMENDTLLQLGDQIRDEMGQEQAKGFISSVAPAIQSALENLKTTREALASGVRTLTGEEQGAEMLGGEPAGDDFGGPADMDAMNPDMGPPMGGEEDAFAAAEPAAGGLGDAGREQRESIQYQNRLLKVLAG